MTTIAIPRRAVARRPEPALTALAAIEIRWAARRASLWLAFAISIVVSMGTTADWQAGSYTEKVVGVSPLGTVAFLTALRAASRDALSDGAMFAAAAPVGASTRSAARLIGLLVPVLMSTALAIGIAVGSRIEGGYWIGEGRWRTDTALHPWYELVQIPLAVAVFGAGGALLGSILRRRWVPVAAILSAAVVLLGSAMWWVWNIPPLHAFAILQVQPLSIDLPAGFPIAELPTNWFVAYPDEFDGLRRMLVHAPTIVAHDIYLIGLFGALAGGTVRGRFGWRLAGAAAAVALIAGIVQVAVYPSV